MTTRISMGLPGQRAAAQLDQGPVGGMVIEAGTLADSAQVGGPFEVVAHGPGEDDSGPGPAGLHYTSHLHDYPD